jgi:shikimate 5-dehydrogenase
MVANNLVLIPGGGGVGRAVFLKLRAQNVPVRFMVRREDERASELKGSAPRSSSGT